MKSFGKFLLFIALAVSIPGFSGCRPSACCITAAKPEPIVGAWLVHESDAPFPFHMYIFSSDGTMQQSNPDAGDPHTSDSAGKGVWVRDGDTIKGKWMEVYADRTTRKYAGRLELTIQLKVNGDNFTGTATAVGYDVNEVQNLGPTKPGPFEGKRVKLP